MGRNNIVRGQSSGFLFGIDVGIAKGKLNSVARPLRIERIGASYHITARGNDRAAIFKDERDRTHLCELLAETTQRYRLILHTYVFMENHYHLLVETPGPAQFDKRLHKEKHLAKLIENVRCTTQNPEL